MLSKLRYDYKVINVLLAFIQTLSEEFLKVSKVLIHISAMFILLG